MRKLIASFTGKNRDFRIWLNGRREKPDNSNVVFLQHCELCGRLAKGDICRRCEPMYQKWTKKVATELAANKNNLDPSIA